MKLCPTFKCVLIVLLIQLVSFVVAMVGSDYSYAMWAIGGFISSITMILGSLAALPLLIIGVVRKKRQFWYSGVLLLFVEVIPLMLACVVFWGWEG